MADTLTFQSNERVRDGRLDGRTDLGTDHLGQLIFVDLGCDQGDEAFVRSGLE
jgi:hypothetical protein